MNAEQIAAELLEKLNDANSSLVRFDLIKSAIDEIWRIAPDQPDIQEAVIRKLDLISRESLVHIS